MDTLLIVITALSLAMATILAIVVAKMARNARRQSDARAALLAEMAAEPAEPIVFRPAPPVPHAVARVAAAPRVQSSPPDDDFELRPAETFVTGAADLFAAPEVPSQIGRRLVAAGAFALVVFVVGFALVSMRPAPARPAPPKQVAAASVTSAPATAPLELMSLRHAQQESGLTITGVVQNPRGNAPVSHVVATVFLFGPDGAFLASGRAPLDFTTLAPGDESPFVVPVAVASTVSRYRIGFRTEDGAVISHVDKRAPEALVRN